MTALSADQPDGQRIAIEFAFARLNGSDDDEHDVENVKQKENEKSDQDETKNSGDDIVNQHRQLKVDRLFAVRIDFGGIGAFGQPDNQRSNNVTGPGYEKSGERGGVGQHAPGPDVGGGYVS